MHKFNGGAVENFFLNLLMMAEKMKTFHSSSQSRCVAILYHSYITIFASWIIPQNSFHCVPTRTSSHPDQIVPHHYISLPPPPLTDQKDVRVGGCFILCPLTHTWFPNPPPRLRRPIRAKKMKDFWSEYYTKILPLQHHSYIIIPPSQPLLLHNFNLLGSANRTMF